MESGRIQPAEAPGLGAFMPEFFGKFPFFDQTGPSGLDSPINQVGEGLDGYIGISRGVAPDLRAGLRILGWGGPAEREIARETDRHGIVHLAKHRQDQDREITSPLAVMMTC
jgi:hypothetical protein